MYISINIKSLTQAYDANAFEFIKNIISAMPARRRHSNTECSL